MPRWSRVLLDLVGVLGGVIGSDDRDVVDEDIGVDGLEGDLDEGSAAEREAESEYLGHPLRDLAPLVRRRGTKMSSSL